MHSSKLLSLPFLYLHFINHASTQVPTTASTCIQNCARVKVSEGYCSSISVFAGAYDKCLKDHCSSSDATDGLQYANSICGASAPGGNSTSGNGTAGLTEYGTTVNNALGAAGLTSLAALLASPAGQGLVNSLSEGNHTVLAPSNEALASLGNVTGTNNTADVQALLKYHVLPGFLNSAALPAGGHAIVRSSLAGEPHVSLPANDSQAIVFAGDQNSLTVIEPTRNITISNTTQVSNLQLAMIPNALTVPGTISTVAAGLPELSSLVSSVNGASPQLFEKLDQTPGLTIFAPINSALSSAGNVSNLQNILINHLVNGTVLYSTVIANVSEAVSAGGGQIHFAKSGADTTATLGSKTVKIVQADILTKSGVIHLVDGLFEASNSTPTFPIPNTNTASETVGITPVGTSPAAIGAKNSAGTPSSSISLITFISSLFVFLGVHYL